MLLQLIFGDTFCTKCPLGYGTPAGVSSERSSLLISLNSLQYPRSTQTMQLSVLKPELYFQPRFLIMLTRTLQANQATVTVIARTPL